MYKCSTQLTHYHKRIENYSLVGVIIINKVIVILGGQLGWDRQPEWLARDVTWTQCLQMLFCIFFKILIGQWATFEL